MNDENKGKVSREEGAGRETTENIVNIEICPFCFGQEIVFDAKIDRKGRYTCKGCGAQFAVAQQLSFDETQFWDEVAENCGFDLEQVKAKAQQLAKVLPKTTGITYGTGAMWHAYHVWARGSGLWDDLVHCETCNDDVPKTEATCFPATTSQPERWICNRCMEEG